VLVGKPIAEIPNLPAPMRLSDERIISDIPRACLDLLTQRPTSARPSSAAVRQRQHRRGARGVLPAHHDDRQRGQHQHVVHEPVRQRRRRVVVLAATGAADLRLRPQPVEPGPGQRAQEHPGGQLREDDPDRAEVADALVARTLAEEQVAGQEQQRNAEAARYELSRLRFRSGVASYLDELDAQRQLFSADRRWCRRASCA
jgi:multidrug efflux system outer membrane protein